jgi:alpha-L-rhamnosidase
MAPSVVPSGAAVTAADFSDIRWHGNWIWCEPLVPPRGIPGLEANVTSRPEVHALFRKTFSLDSVPERAPARITADSRYLLFLNGREVFRGPIRSQPRRMFYDLFDLAPYLNAGENTVAIYVCYYGSPKSFWMPAPTTMSLGTTGVLVFEANLGAEAGPLQDAEAVWLVTDGSWKTHKSSAWSSDWQKGTHFGFMEDGIPVEVFDARQLAAGWEQPGFDDSAWGNATMITTRSMNGAGRSQPPAEPYGPLHPRPIAKLGGECLVPLAGGQVQLYSDDVDPAIGDPVKRLAAIFKLNAAGAAQAASLPVTVQPAAGGSARITLDMGRLVMGQVQFELDAPAGAEIDFSYTEDPLAPPNGGFGGMHSGTRYIARGANDRFSVYDALGFRYANILMHAAAGAVTLRSFALQEDVYQWQPGAEFACSDVDLNAVFKAGIRTVQLNSRDSFTDCPTREQQAWVGDSVVHQMVHLVTNTDWRLAWHYLTLSDSPRYDGILPMTVVGPSEAAGGMTIPDWSLHWVHGVYNLYRFSGDREALISYMPSVARVLRWFVPFQNANGQIQDMIEWALIDWSAVSVAGISSIYTAIWARGLREFAEMAGWLGENASRDWAEKLYARAKAGFEMFWDEERGSYIDHIVDGVKCPEMSQLAGALAVVSGLAPQSRWQRIMNRVTDPQRVSIRTWMFDADDPAGFPDMNAPRRPRWDTQEQVVLAEPFMSYVVHDAVAAAGLAGRLPELCRRWSAFLTSGYDTIGENWRHGTHVHGWSCTPTKDLIFYTLGVTPAEPGYTKARIAPNLGDLAWAEGKVPTPHGLIALRVEAGRITVDSPIPLIVELTGQAPRQLPAGKHEIR